MISKKMTLESLQKETRKEFDKEFPNNRAVFEGGDPYLSRRRAIKAFISSREKIAYEAGVKDTLKEVNKICNKNR